MWARAENVTDERDAYDGTTSHEMNGADIYSAGDCVPEQFVETRREDTPAFEFAVAVEVVEGFDGFRHIYPKTPVDAIDEVVAAADGANESSPAFPDKVRVYTLPREEL